MELSLGRSRAGIPLNLMKRELRTRSVGTKVSDAEMRVLASRAAAGPALSERVRRAASFVSRIDYDVQAAR
jgi:hypothetical protein